MTEITVRDYLARKLAPVEVYLETPERPPESYVLVRQTGSDRDNRILEDDVALQSIAPSRYEALVLNDRVKAAMDVMGPADGVFIARINTDYEFTDTSTKSYRYQAIYQIYH